MDRRAFLSRLGLVIGLLAAVGCRHLEKPRVISFATSLPTLVAGRLSLARSRLGQIPLRRPDPRSRARKGPARGIRRQSGVSRSRARLRASLFLRAARRVPRPANRAERGMAHRRRPASGTSAARSAIRSSPTPRPDHRLSRRIPSRRRSPASRRHHRARTCRRRLFPRRHRPRHRAASLKVSAPLRFSPPPSRP